MQKLLFFVLLLYTMLYGNYDYEMNIEKSMFSKNEIFKMAQLGVTVALDGEGYQAEERVKNSMSPKDLINAKLLDLSGINLQVIPSWLFRFHNLRYLNLSNTNIDIKEIKKLLNANSFEKLDVLILSNNILFEDSNESFDDLINILPNLNSLDLSNTQGGALNYKGIDKLKNLQELNLNHNKIEGIEQLALDRLKNLQKIEISFNRLESVDLSLFPKTISSIDLSNNGLKELKVVELQYLENLNLANNPELKNTPKLCGEFVFSNKSAIKGTDICNSYKNINYFIRLGVFSKKENAKKIINKLLKKSFPVFIETKNINSKLYYSVKIGFYDNKEIANHIQKSLPKIYREDSQIYKDKRKDIKKYVVRFGLFSKVDNVKKIQNSLLSKKISAFIIKREINHKYLYSLEVGFFDTKEIAKSKKQEILRYFPENYFEEEPIVR